MIDGSSTNRDKYLVIKAKGGMGNRMLCAVTGIIYGQITGRKTIVDWRDGSYSNDGLNVFDRFFTCPAVYSETVLPEDATVCPALWKNQLNKSMSKMLHEYDPNKHKSILIHRKYSIDVSKVDYDEDIIVFWYYTQRINSLRKSLGKTVNGFAGLSTAQIIRKVLREQMILNDESRRKIADFKAENWKKPVIGVHIRHTDMKTNLAQYEKPLREFTESAPDASIFLATDNRQVSEDYKKRFQRVFSVPKWFPDKASSMHQNPGCPDKVSNGIEALVDMYLLADCDYLIYPGGSTFSWIAQLLSDIPQKRVVDIERFNPKVRLKRWIRELVA